MTDRVTGVVTRVFRAPGSGRLFGSGLSRRGQEVGEVFEFGQKAGSGVLPVGDDQRFVRVHALTCDVAVTGGQVGGVSSAVTDRTAVRLTGLRLSRGWGLGVGSTGSPGGAFGSEVGEGGGVVAGAGLGSRACGSIGAGGGGLLTEQVVAYDRPTAGSQAQGRPGGRPSRPSPGWSRAAAGVASGGESSPTARREGLTTCGGPRPENL
ncbi:hypothetical protein GCM10020367_43410 [Streptomyces sannanensis]|uniref:Uncharacterized protein n=1 Tax=Streptomyces sannanensis TaxID=285536 RepID=A0ABP6SFH0_9ACTN